MPEPAEQQDIVLPEVKGRPVFLYERLVVAPRPNIQTPLGPVARIDPTLITPPERIKVDHIIACHEDGQLGGMAVRPSLREREYWPTIPLSIDNYDNHLREPVPNDYQGTHWLKEPYLLRRGHSISIEIQNRMVDFTLQGEVVFQGIGFKSKRPYDLVVPFETAPGTLEGRKQTFGGQTTARVSGREDVLIKAVSWRRGIETEGWNPRLIGLGIHPSYGQKWHSPGGTARGAGEDLPPLVAYSNVRGPLVDMFYSPPTDLFLEQGDDITFEFYSQIQGADRTVLLMIVGTTTAE